MGCHGLVEPNMIKLVALAFISYWAFFVGYEFVSLVRLFTSGKRIYNIMPPDATQHDQNDENDGPVHNDIQVPLIMHRMWRDDSITNPDTSELPLRWHTAFNNCSEQYHGRNWTTVLWTDETIRAFLVRRYPDFVPVYESYPYNIQRVDAARYFILYHYGGVYLDLDIECRPRKDLTVLVKSMERLGKVAMAPLTKPIGLSNDVLFASKASPFFKKLIDALPSKNKWYGLPYLTVMFSTGPMFLSLEYMRLPNDLQKEVLVLPPEMYVELGTRYIKHLRGSTWHRSDAHVIWWLHRHRLCFAGFLLTVIASRARIRFARLLRAKRRRS